MSLIPVYRRRPTPLHAARAGVGIAFCASFLAVGVLYSSPPILAGALSSCADVTPGSGRTNSMN